MLTYIINLRRRPDRRARIAAQLPPELNPMFTSDWEGPFDGSEMDADALKGFTLFPWKIDSESVWWSRPLRTGEVGCAISHWRCWQDASTRSEDLILILEDDVRLADGFAGKLHDSVNRLQRRDPTWDFLYLGRLRCMNDRPIGDGFVRPGFSFCGCSYVLSRRGLAKLLAARYDQAIMPIDDFLPALYFLHPREDIRRRFLPILNAFALEQDIAFHDGFPGDSDADTSAFIE